MPVTPKPRTVQQRGRVRDAVLGTLERKGPLTPIAIIRALPGVRAASVHCVLRRLCESGQVELVGEGGRKRSPYRATGRRSPPRVPARVALRWLSMLAGGHAFRAGDVSDATGCSRQNADMAIRDALAKGLVVRVGRGSFRRAGGDPDERPRLNMAGTMRRLMATEDRAWHHAELAPHLAPEFPTVAANPMRCLWLLHNMARIGDVARVGEGTFVLLRKEPPSPTGPQAPHGTDGVADALLHGGLWLTTDLAEVTGLPIHHVRRSLMHLAEKGDAVEAYQGQWRHADVAVDPAWDARSMASAILGVLLRGGEWQASDIARAINWDGPVAPRAHRLIGQGFAELVRYGVYRCVPGVVEEFAARFAVRGAAAPTVADAAAELAVPTAAVPVTERAVKMVAPASKPPVEGDLDRRVLDAMARRGIPVRKVDLAAFSGIDGRSVERSIRRLVAAGRVREAVPGRFRLAA